jgi:hypothetical protein
MLLSRCTARQLQLVSLKAAVLYNINKGKNPMFNMHSRVRESPFSWDSVLLVETMPG